MTPEEQNLDMLVAELDSENRLLRARNERLEKEAEQPAQQEPVAKDNSNYRLDQPGLDPLYTSPPAQRTWVEVEQVKWEGDRLIAKLKEKNT